MQHAETPTRKYSAPSIRNDWRVFCCSSTYACILFLSFGPISFFFHSVCCECALEFRLCVICYVNESLSVAQYKANREKEGESCRWIYMRVCAVFGIELWVLRTRAPPQANTTAWCGSVGRCVRVAWACASPDVLERTFEFLFCILFGAHTLSIGKFVKAERRGITICWMLGSCGDAQPRRQIESLIRTNVILSQNTRRSICLHICAFVFFHRLNFYLWFIFQQRLTLQPLLSPILCRSPCWLCNPDKHTNTYRYAYWLWFGFGLWANRVWNKHIRIRFFLFLCSSFFVLVQ